jgi:hypothetical protein
MSGRVNWWWVICLLALIFVSWRIASVQASCPSAGRALTEQELIDAALSSIVPVSGVEGEDQPRGPLQDYGSIAEFRERNPNCCELAAGIHVVDQRRTAVQYIKEVLLAQYSARVRVHYQRYRDSGAQDYVANIVTDACGGRPDIRGYYQTSAPD